MASKRKSSDKNANQPAPELLTEAEKALRRLGNPDFDFDDVCLSEEEREWVRHELRQPPPADPLERLLGYTNERLVLLLARRLSDTPKLRDAINLAERLREYAERLREHAEAVAKSVAATALAYDERAARHHVAQLLRGPLSADSLSGPLGEELPPVDPMTDALFGYCVFRRSEAVFKKVLPVVKDKEPDDALAIVRARDPEVADWIEHYAIPKKNFLLLLTQAAKPRSLGRAMSLQRNLALKLGASILEVNQSTFEDMVNRAGQKSSGRGRSRT